MHSTGFDTPVREVEFGSRKESLGLAFRWPHRLSAAILFNVLLLECFRVLM